jgi:hypothetical protein
MFSGPPLPLPVDLPLNWLVHCARRPGSLGAWVRGSPHRQLCLTDTSEAAVTRVLVSSDLGFLLARCSNVALRENRDAVVLAADQVIQWRTLQVITGMPYLPPLDGLNIPFPGVHLGPTGVLVPIGARSPEDVLAECLARRVPVVGTQIVYCAPPIEKH